MMQNVKTDISKSLEGAVKSGLSVVHCDTWKVLQWTLT